MLKNPVSKRSYIVAPLNQLVDERYTIYWSVDAAGAGGDVAAGAWIASIAAIVLASACMWGRRNPHGAANRHCNQEEIPCEVAASELLQHAAPARASEPARQKAAASDCMSSPAGSQQLFQPAGAPEAAIVAAPASEPDMSAFATESMEDRPALSPGAVRSASASALTMVVGASTDGDAERASSKQQQLVNSYLSSPIPKRHTSADCPMAAEYPSACNDSDAADDVTTSCGSFELLGAAE